MKPLATGDTLKLPEDEDSRSSSSSAASEQSKATSELSLLSVGPPPYVWESTEGGSQDTKGKKKKKKKKKKEGYASETSSSASFVGQVRASTTRPLHVGAHVSRQTLPEEIEEPPTPPPPVLEKMVPQSEPQKKRKGRPPKTEVGASSSLLVQPSTSSQAMEQTTGPSKQKGKGKKKNSSATEKEDEFDDMPVIGPVPTKSQAPKKKSAPKKDLSPPPPIKNAAASKKEAKKEAPVEKPPPTKRDKSAKRDALKKDAPLKKDEPGKKRTRASRAASPKKTSPVKKTTSRKKGKGGNNNVDPGPSLAEPEPEFAVFSASEDALMGDVEPVADVEHYSASTLIDNDEPMLDSDDSVQPILEDNTPENFYDYFPSSPNAMTGDLIIQEMGEMEDLDDAACKLSLHDGESIGFGNESSNDGPSASSVRLEDDFNIEDYDLSEPTLDGELLSCAEIPYETLESFPKIGFYVAGAQSAGAAEDNGNEVQPQDSVAAEDLDGLQDDLEDVLTSNVSRSRSLRRERNILDTVENVAVVLDKPKPRRKRKGKKKNVDVSPTVAATDTKGEEAPASSTSKESVGFNFQNVTIPSTSADLSGVEFNFQELATPGSSKEFTAFNLQDIPPVPGTSKGHTERTFEYRPGQDNPVSILGLSVGHIPDSNTADLLFGGSSTTSSERPSSPVPSTSAAAIAAMARESEERAAKAHAQAKASAEPQPKKKGRPRKKVPDININPKKKPTGCPAVNKPLPHIGYPKETPKDEVDRFWDFVNDYCRKITIQDLKNLQKQIDMQAQPPAGIYDIPPLGKHWKEGLQSRARRTPRPPRRVKPKDKIGPLTEQLVSVLVDERIAMQRRDQAAAAAAAAGQGTSREAAGSGSNQNPDPAYPPAADGYVLGTGVAKALGLVGGANSTVPLETRIRNSLLANGLEVPVDPNAEDDDDPEDEILAEIKRTQKLHKKLHRYNSILLRNLYILAEHDLRRTRITDELDIADRDLVIMYKMMKNHAYKRTPHAAEYKRRAFEVLRIRSEVVDRLDKFDDKPLHLIDPNDPKEEENKEEEEEEEATNANSKRSAKKGPKAPKKPDNA